MSKVAFIHYHLPPDAQNEVRFVLRPAVFNTCYSLYFPTHYNVNCQNIYTKQMTKKIKISNFINLLTILAEFLSRSIHGYWVVNLVYTFRGDVVWFFSTVWFPENKNDKKNGPKISWIGTFPQNFTLIHFMLQTKTGFTVTAELLQVVKIWW